MLQKSADFHLLAAENGSVKISPSSCDNVCSIPSAFLPLSLSLQQDASYAIEGIYGITR